MRGGNQHGYTMIELVVAASIFMLISVVAVATMVSVLHGSTKSASQRTVQQDARVNMEDVARTVRASSIDYSFYEKAATEGSKCVLPSNSSGSIALPLIWTQAVPGGDPEQKRVIYFFDEGASTSDTDGALYRYESDAGAKPPSCAGLFASPSKVRISSAKVAVQDAKFRVSPLQDPFDSPCSDKNSSCQVHRDTHPRVTVTIDVRTLQGNPRTVDEQSNYSETTLQTTVGTRAYPISGLYGQSGSGTVPTPGPTPTPPPPPPAQPQSFDGKSFESCQVLGDQYYCNTNDPQHARAVVSFHGGNGNPRAVVAYRSSVGAGRYTLTLSYYNADSVIYGSSPLFYASTTFPFLRSFAPRVYPPPNYSYHVTVSWAGGSKVVNLPIESDIRSATVRDYKVTDINLPDNGTITVTWDNDQYVYNQYDTDFGLEALRLQPQ